MRTNARVRVVLSTALLIGIVLIVAPFAMHVPSKAGAGQKMLDAFHPIMQPAAVQTTVNYFDQTFTALGPVAQGSAAAAAEIPKLFGDLAKNLHMTQPQLAQFLSTNYPAMARMLQQFPQLVPIFKAVPPGLAWYHPMVHTMASQMHNYAKVNSLPNFNLFTWFFVIPGVLIVLVTGYGLVELGRPRGDPAGVPTTSAALRQPAAMV